MEKKRLIRIVLATAIVVFVGLAVATILILTKTHLPCPINLMTRLIYPDGLLCPGCGNTRATLALLRFDFKSMLEYNLLYPIEIGYIGYVYIICSINYIKKGHFFYGSKTMILDIVVLIAVIVWTIVRNVIHIFN